MGARLCRLCRQGTLHGGGATGGLSGGVAGEGALPPASEGLVDGGAVSGEVGQGVEHLPLPDDCVHQVAVP